MEVLLVVKPLRTDLLEGYMAQREANDVRKLSEGGLAIGFETVGTLLQCTYSAAEDEDQDNVLQWTVIGHGIPAVIANENGVALCLADFETGDKLCSFTVTEASQYTVVQEDFHIFTKPSGCFGLVLTNCSVANKLFACLKCIVLSSSTDPEEGKGKEEENEGIEPAPKRLCADTEDEDDSDENNDDIDDGEDDTDGITRMASMRKKKKKKLPEISGPQDFEHVSHVGKDASVLDLSHILSWKGTLNKKEHISTQVISIPSSSRHESGTEESSSFEEVTKASVPPPPAVAAPPPPPPPPAVAPPPPKVQLKKKADSSMASNGAGGDAKSSLIDEIKKGVMLRPVGDERSSCGGSAEGKKTTYSSIQEELKSGFVLKTRSRTTMTLPMPPKKRESGQLMFEIRTFRRNKLRDISMTDFPVPALAPPDENSLESILKKRLDAMFHKISDSGEFGNTGMVDCKGEDSFDGVLFGDS